MWSSWMRIYDRGTTIILGEVGDNFGAGMTGGMAFVYDEKDTLKTLQIQPQ